MIDSKKVAFHTLGCKLNFSETSTISRLFEDAGFAKVDIEQQPDVFVLNTCSVTENADKKCKQIIRKAVNANPKVFVVVIGCFAQLKPEEISKIYGVDLVLGANEKFNILAHLDTLDKKKQGKFVVEKIKNTNDFIPSYSQGDRTRSFLKIQDGCDYFCTFCTIPLARGKSRNASIENTLKETQKVVTQGAKEIVLTGVNIGDFGQGGTETFFQLIRLLDQVKGIERYRISSIEPNLLSDEIIHFCLTESVHFVPHFHIPLQSGSDKMLKAMRRKYLSALFAERVAKIKSCAPDACIGVDVIVGFPGETEEEFLKTYRFLNELNISYLHVFTYSERAKTGAIKMENSIPMEVRRERSKRLHILSEKKKRAFYEENIGKIAIALMEADNNDGFMHGFTANYIKVKLPFNENLINKMVSVKLEKIDSEGIMCATMIN
jgi:threonylcarbamoyladenosine tRNA methylthiotransferase MtaB